MRRVVAVRGRATARLGMQPESAQAAPVGGLALGRRVVAARVQAGESLETRASDVVLPGDPRRPNEPAGQAAGVISLCLLCAEPIRGRAGPGALPRGRIRPRRRRSQDGRGRERERRRNQRSDESAEAGIREAAMITHTSGVGRSRLRCESSSGYPGERSRRSISVVFGWAAGVCRLGRGCRPSFWGSQWRVCLAARAYFCPSSPAWRGMGRKTTQPLTPTSDIGGRYLSRTAAGDLPRPPVRSLRRFDALDDQRPVIEPERRRGRAGRELHLDGMRPGSDRVR